MPGLNPTDCLAKRDRNRPSVHFCSAILKACPGLLLRSKFRCLAPVIVGFDHPSRGNQVSGSDKSLRAARFSRLIPRFSEWLRRKREERNSIDFMVPSRAPSRRPLREALPSVERRCQGGGVHSWPLVESA